MIVMNGHGAAEHSALVEAQTTAELDIAVRGQDLIEAARFQERVAPVGAVTAVDIWSADNVARRQGVEIPGSESLVVVDGVSQLRVQVHSVGADDLAAERDALGVLMTHPQKVGQPGRGRDAIVVQEGQQLATGSGDADIAGASDTRMLSQLSNPNTGIGWIHPVIYRAAVEDKQQFVGDFRHLAELIRNGICKAPAALLTPSCRHDDADIDAVR